MLKENVGNYTWARWLESRTPKGHRYNQIMNTQPLLGNEVPVAVRKRFLAWRKKTHIFNSLRHNTKEMQELQKSVYCNYYAMKKTSRTMRDTWISELTARVAKESNQRQEGILASMLYQEAQRKAFWRIKNLWKLQGGRLTKTKIQGAKCTKKEDTEQGCMKEN